MVPLDRDRRVVLGTSMERLEHVPRRIRGGITRIRCQIHLRRIQFVVTDVENEYDRFFNDTIVFT